MGAEVPFHRKDVSLTLCPSELRVQVAERLQLSGHTPAPFLTENLILTS